MAIGGAIAGSGRRRYGILATATVLALSGPILGLGAPSTVDAAGCDLSTLGLSRTSIATSDGVHYTKWSGHVPSWDGLPLDIDVSLPAAPACARPMIVFAHGFTDSKTRWETDTMDGRPGDPNAWRWNNVWFVAHGYAVLNYTARGWHGSCGPDSSTDPANSPLGLPAACTGGNPALPTRQYWIHLDDLRYEVRDAQWLTGRLVDAGATDPAHVGVTGGSYGGGLTWLMARANDRVVCGGVGWDAANGADPCAGKTTGQLVPWRSRLGTPLHVAAAVPEYTWASLADVLLPNGRASDAEPGAAPSGNRRVPIGIPLESYTDVLFAATYAPPATKNGFLQPPSSTDETSNIPLWVAVNKAGVDTVSVQTPAVNAIATNALIQLEDYKSPLTGLVPFDARVPIYQLQGLTDPLFPAVHAELMLNAARAFAADYPIGDFYADYGHPYASQLGNVPHVFNPIASAFFDHYLLGSGAAPDLTATVAAVKCVTGTAADPLETYHGPTLATLADTSLTFDSAAAGQTSNVPSGSEGPATDPVSNGVVGPGIFGTRCPHIAQTTDPGQVTWSFPLNRAATVVGSPIVRVHAASTGPDAELNTRLWDVGTDGTQTLMSRGTYRLAQAGGNAAATITYELSPTAWQIASGHSLKLEVSGADAPYFQLDRIPAITTVDSVRLVLPTTSQVPRQVGGVPATASPAMPTSGLPSTSQAGLGGGALVGRILVAVAFVAMVLLAANGHRRLRRR